MTALPRSTSRRPTRPSFTGPLPIYVQIANVLRDRIAQGEIEVGAQLPSEGRLAREFGVSRLTARQAVGALVAEGLIERARGRVAVVVHSPVVETRTRRLTGSLTHDFKGFGREMRFKLLENRREPARPQVAERLGLPAGAPAIRIDRIMNYCGKPLGRITVWLPEEFGARLEAEDLEEVTLLSLLSAKHGIRAVEGEQTIEAALAEPILATLLHVSVGMPVLRVRSVFRTEGGRAISYAVMDYRADRYVCTVSTR